MMEHVVVSGRFDNIQSRDVRFLEEAARFGPLHVYLWSDHAAQMVTGTLPMFPQEERKYLLEALRFVGEVRIINLTSSADELPRVNCSIPKMWIVRETEHSFEKERYCISQGITYEVIKDSALQGFSVSSGNGAVQTSSRKRVVVTGCFDWFHSGHVRFFEETSQLGDLFVVVGHDENVRLLKGQGHPLFSADVRRYMVGSVRFVKQALVSSGSGWMDAEPEIAAIQPHIYAVNEDGDKPEKRAFCQQHGFEYVVLKRTPARGLPRRQSTHLRGF